MEELSKGGKIFASAVLILLSFLSVALLSGLALNAVLALAVIAERVFKFKAAVSLKEAEVFIAVLSASAGALFSCYVWFHSVRE